MTGPICARSKGSFAQVNCFDRSLAMLRSGRIHTGGLITHRFPLERYGDALGALASDPTCLKAVVMPGGSPARDPGAA
jgi:D-arabinitol dehydrogenase (NADP+)